MNGNFFFFSLQRRTIQPPHLQFSQAARPVLLLFFLIPHRRYNISLTSCWRLLLVNFLSCALFSFFFIYLFFPFPHHLPSALISTLAFISASLNSLSLFLSFIFCSTNTPTSTHSATSSLTRSSEPPATYPCASIANVWRIVLQNCCVSSPSRQLSQQLQVDAHNCRAGACTHARRHTRTNCEHSPSSGLCVPRASGSSVAGGGRAAGFRASGGCGAREVEDRQRARVRVRERGRDRESA